MASARLLSALREQGYQGRVTVVGEEPVPFYNRVLLPDYLAARQPLETLCAQRPDGTALPFTLTVLNREAVIGFDPRARSATLASGRTLDWEALVLATGSAAPRPSVPGIDYAGVHALRNLADADTLAQLAQSPGNVVVIGGGLLGLEAAHALRALGKPVTVVHRHRELLNRQLDGPAAALLQAALVQQGIDFAMNDTLCAVDGGADGHVQGVRLNSGAQLACHTVLLATGTRARDRLGAAAGLETDDGVLVNEHLETEVPNVFAIGECARVCDPQGQHRYGLVAPVHRQAEALAARLSGGRQRFVAPPASTRLKVAGITLYSAGDIARLRTADPRLDIRTVRHDRRGLYRRLAFDNNRLIAAVLLGDSRGSTAIEASFDGAPCSALQQDALLLGTAAAA